MVFISSVPVLQVVPIEFGWNIVKQFQTPVLSRFDIGNCDTPIAYGNRYWGNDKKLGNVWLQNGP